MKVVPVAVAVLLAGAASAAERNLWTGSSSTPSGMVRVPAGSFRMGSTSGDDDEKPVHEVFVSGFSIDRTEVTVGAYRQCVDAGRCLSSGLTDVVRQPESCNWGQSGREDHPINCVTWSEAKAYCSWAGKRLPTEAEWEKAARGTDGRTYPWGNESASCSRAVMDDGGNGCGRGGMTWAVGSKPSGKSPYGALDLAGNVWEWVSDWYDDDYYHQSPSRDPTGPTNGEARVHRGGAWYDFPEFLRASVRTGGDPLARDPILGFRCARDGA